MVADSAYNSVNSFWSPEFFYTLLVNRRISSHYIFHMPLGLLWNAVHAYNSILVDYSSFNLESCVRAVTTLVLLSLFTWETT